MSNINFHFNLHAWLGYTEKAKVIQLEKITDKIIADNKWLYV